jgi:hypothetical protein
MAEPHTRQKGRLLREKYGVGRTMADIAWDMMEQRDAALRERDEARMLTQATALLALAVMALAEREYLGRANVTGWEEIALRFRGIAESGWSDPE